MKRKSMAILLAMLLMIQLAAYPAAAAEADVTFTLGTASGNPGDTVSVALSMESLVDIDRIGVAGLTYDADVLEFVEFKDYGSVITSSLLGSAGVDQTKKAIVIAYSPASKINGSMCSIAFKIKENAAAGEYGISFTPVVKIGDSNIANVSVEKGTVTVVKKPIADVAITVAAPARGVALPAEVSCGSDAYTGEIVWFEGTSIDGTQTVGTAKANQVYTAKIVISPDTAAGESFANPVEVSVNGETAVSMVPEQDGTITVVRTFAETGDKESPVCAAPTDLQATYGQTLAEIPLTNVAGNTPGTWEWMNVSEPVGNVGIKSFKAKFIPDDTNNYLTVLDIDVSVAVGAKSVMPTVEVTPAVYDYTGEAIIPTSVVVKDGDTIIPASEYSLSYISNTNAGTASVKVTDAAGGNYSIEETSQRFTINPIAPVIEVLDPAAIVYDGSTVECGNGKELNYTYNGDGTVSVKWYADSNGVKGSEIAAPSAAGAYWIGVSAGAGKNYKAVSEVEKRFVISPAANIIEGLACAAVEYGGTPAPAISNANYNAAGVEFTYAASENGEYGNWDTKNDVGTYYVKATIPSSDNYSEGTSIRSFQVVPKSLAKAAIGTVDDRSYTGSELQPEPSVTLDGILLEKNKDFEFAYSDNTYVGTAEIRVTGKGNYTGSADNGQTFAINAIEDPAIITLTASVTKGGNTVDLSNNVSMAKGTVRYAIQGEANGCTISNSVLTSGNAAGSVTVTVSVAGTDVNNDGTNEYTGKSADIVVTISEKESKTLIVTQNGCTYGETLSAPVFNKAEGFLSGTLEVRYNGTTKAGAVYSSAIPPVAAGTYTVAVRYETQTEIWQGTSANFNIAQKSISGATVALGDALTYNGSPQTQAVSKVMLDTKDISAFCDVSNNVQTNAGRYDLTVTAKDSSNYVGEATAEFVIAAKTAAASVTVEGGPFAYTGTKIEPAVIVKDEDTVIDSGEYTVSYSNNEEAGIAAVSISDKPGGNYSVSGGTTFVIEKGTYKGDKETSGSGKYGTSGTVDLSAVLGPSISAIEIDTVSDPDNILAEAPSRVDNALLYKIRDDAELVGKAAVVQLVISSKNYEDYTAEVTLTVVEKDVQNIVFETDSVTKVYGDADFIIPVAGIMTEASYVSSNTDVATVENTGKVHILKAGIATITVNAAEDSVYAEAHGSYVLTVNKAIPKYTVPAGLRGTKGAALSSVALPNAGNGYWTWDDPTAMLDSVGQHTFTATFTPNDTENYEIVSNLDVTVTVQGAETDIWTVTVIGSRAGVTGAGEYTEGDTVYIDAGARRGYAFIGWTSDEVFISDSNSRKASFIMPGHDVTVKANWVIEPYIPSFDPSEPETPFEPVKPEPVIPEDKGESTEFVLPFKDISVKDWFYSDICYAVKNNLMNGISDDAFLPDGTTTRAMIVTILYRLEGEPVESDSCPFSDAIPAWARRAVIWAAKHEIVVGYGDGRFGAYDRITREQMACILWRYAKYCGVDCMSNLGSSLPFRDAHTVSDWANEALYWCNTAGLINGMGDGTLAPQENTTRAQVAAILHRFCELLSQG